MQALNQIEFAAVMGVSQSYISQLKAEGRLVMIDGLIDPDASLQRIAETANPGRMDVAERHLKDRLNKLNAQQNPAPASAPNGAALEDIAGKAGSAYQQARAMREKYAAMQAKIAYEKEVGILLMADDCKIAVADGDAIIRNRLEALPDILAPQLAAEKDEQKIRALLTDQVEYLLSELSRTFNGLIHER